MTKNQLDYWRLVEEKRHNRQLEREEERSNRATVRERSIQTMLEHRARVQANLINAQLQSRAQAETQRSNLARERLTALSQDIDRARIQLGYDQSATSKQIASINAAVGYANVGAAYANVAEQQRTHQVYEQLQSEAQAEQARHNYAQESVQMSGAASQQTRAAADLMRAKLSQDQWNQVGYDQALANLTQTRAQTLQSWAQTDLTRAQTSVVGVNAASNLIGSGANVLKSLKGGKLNGSK